MTNLVLSITLVAGLRSVLPPTAPDLLGKAAPSFRLPATDGRTYSLADYRGRQPVVLVWYAALFT